jgi:ATP synthase protein I
MVATAVLAALGGLLAGEHGAVSAALGGAVSLGAGWASAWVATSGREKSAGGVLVTALKAEGVKLGVIVALLWLVLSFYAEAVVAVFLGSFVVTALIFSMAFFVSDNKQPGS